MDQQRPLSEVARLLTEIRQDFCDKFEQFLTTPNNELLNQLVNSRNIFLAAANATEDTISRHQSEPAISHELRTAASLFNCVHLLEDTHTRGHAIDALNRLEHVVAGVIDMLLETTETFPLIDNEAFSEDYLNWLQRIEND